MSGKSTIEWTEATWNPVRGCTKISPGCKHCYAETFAERFRGVEGNAYEQGFTLRLVPDALDLPLRWRTPRLIFANSMSDLFQEGVPVDFIARAFAVMALAPRHTFQVLTKRAGRMREELSDAGFYARVIDAADREFRPRRPELRGISRPPARNVWLGVSVEDRQFGLARVEELRQTPASVRFLSIEPLLEDLGQLDLRGIGWVIVGGESGLGARPMKAEWVRSIRDQCRAARVPFFFKQWGGLRKKVAGRLLDGLTWDEMPAQRQEAA